MKRSLSGFVLVFVLYATAPFSTSALAKPCEEALLYRNLWPVLRDATDSFDKAIEIKRIHYG